MTKLTRVPPRLIKEIKFDTMAALKADETSLAAYQTRYGTTGTIFATIRDGGETYSLDLTQTVAGDVTNSADPAVKFNRVDNVLNFGGATMTRGPENSAHVSLQGIKPDTGSAFWNMPNGYPSPSGPSKQVSSTKNFFEPYDQLAEQFGGVDDQFSSYRVGVFYVNNANSAKGDGSVVFGSEGGVPFNPEVHLGAQNNDSSIPFRVIWAQGREINAGNYFAGGVCKFEEGYPFWREGMPTTQGQIVHLAGRIYEAQSAGTTGSNPPLHGRFQLVDLTVSDASGFEVDEYINVVPFVNAATSPLGRIYDKPDSTTLRIYAENPAGVAGLWAAAQDIIGQVSGETDTISAVGSSIIDYDYTDPYSLSDSFGVIAKAVAGRVVSDGGVSWNFIDDITQGGSRNPLSYQVVVMGGEDVEPIYFNTDLMYQIGGGKKIGFTDGGGIEFFDPTTRDKQWNVEPTDANVFEIMHSEGKGVKIDLFNSLVELIGLSLKMPSGVCPNAATTFDTTGVGVVTFTSGAATNFTGFTGGTDGQTIHCRFIGSGPTFIHSDGSLELGGSDFAPGSRSGATFTCFGTIWVLTGTSP